MKKALLALLLIALTQSAFAQSEKISQLGSASTLTGSELILGVQSGSNVSITPTQIGTYVAGQSLTLTNKTLTIPIIGSQLLTTGSAPSVVGGTGAGTSPTVTVSGNNIAGQITCLTGSSPASGGANVVIMTYNGQPITQTPKAVILTPGNAAAAALSGSTQVIGEIGNPTTQYFVIIGGSSALAGTTTYIWNYFIIQ